jgi:hypothetical protein
MSDIDKSYEEFRKHDYEHGGTQKAYYGAGYVAGMKFMNEALSSAEKELKDAREVISAIAVGNDHPDAVLENAEKARDFLKKWEGKV